MCTFSGPPPLYVSRICDLTGVFGVMMVLKSAKPIWTWWTSKRKWKRLRDPRTTISARWKKGTQKNVKTTLKKTMRFGDTLWGQMLARGWEEIRREVESPNRIMKKIPKELQFLYEKYYQCSAKALSWVTMCTHACGRWCFWRYFLYPLPTLLTFPGRGDPRMECDLSFLTNKKIKTSQRHVTWKSFQSLWRQDIVITAG